MNWGLTFNICNQYIHMGGNYQTEMTGETDIVKVFSIKIYFCMKKQYSTAFTTMVVGK